MTQSPTTANDNDLQADSLVEFRAINAWLERPPLPSLTEELETLTSQAIRLRQLCLGQEVRTDTLGKIYCRSIIGIERVLPAFTRNSFPTPRKLKLTARPLQSLLHIIGEDLISTALIESTPNPEARLLAETTSWRGMHALSCHLLISHLAAAPAEAGVWQLLHTTYSRISKLGVAALNPAGASSTYQNLYFAAVLVSCGLPASFSSRETRFIADYLLQNASLVGIVGKPDDFSTSTFWIDSTCDAPATPSSRKVAPPEVEVIYFDCNRVTSLIGKQLAALRSGLRPEEIGLDRFAGTPAGRGTLRRLAEALGTPGKRRFPRRRQHYRAVLCAGLDNLWRLFNQGSDTGIETSSWMITNESPDGYLIMHVLGKSSDVRVGDVVAIRAEEGDRWQVCITRWARSENQEHLEFGLQILAISAIPAMLNSTKGYEETPCESYPQPVLILPKVPPLRTDEMLITPSGFLDEQRSRLALVIEQGNIEIREVRSTQIDEQTAHIEVFRIEPEIGEASAEHAKPQAEQAQ